MPAFTDRNCWAWTARVSKACAELESLNGFWSARLGIARPRRVRGRDHGAAKATEHGIGAPCAALPPNGNVPVRADASFEASASRSTRRARWSLVLTVSGRRPRAWAASSTLISSTARIMNTILKGSGSLSMLRSRRPPIPCRAAARSGSMSPSVNGTTLAPLLPPEAPRLSKPTVGRRLRTRPSASLRTILVSHVERLASLRNSHMAAKARTPS